MIWLPPANSRLRQLSSACPQGPCKPYRLQLFAVFRPSYGNQDHNERECWQGVCTLLEQKIAMLHVSTSRYVLLTFQCPSPLSHPRYHLASTLTTKSIANVSPNHMDFAAKPLRIFSKCIELQRLIWLARSRFGRLLLHDHHHPKGGCASSELRLSTQICLCCKVGRPSSQSMENNMFGRHAAVVHKDGAHFAKQF